MKKNKTYPFFRQKGYKECGPACLKMILEFYNQHISINNISKLCKINENGISIFDLIKAANKIGLEPIAVKIYLKNLFEIRLPCIAFLHQGHYVVIYEIENNTILIADPSNCLIHQDLNKFKRGWIPHNRRKGIILLFG